MAETDHLLTGILYGVLILCLATGGWLVYRQWHSGDRGQRLVTVDVVRILNAERKALPKLSDGGDPSLKLLQIGRQIGPTVERVADGAVVLVKQSVVGSDLPDITDAVLDRLGLPRNAPTIDLTGALNDAPTSSSASVGGLWKAHLKQMREQAARTRANGKTNALDRALP